MVLTTHSMEEADVLCNKICIVNNGVLTCLGTQNRLKSLYGGGYHLFINCERTIENQEMEVQKFIKQILPRSQLLRSFNGQMAYQVSIEGFSASKLFKEME